MPACTLIKKLIFDAQEHIPTVHVEFTHKGHRVKVKAIKKPKNVSGPPSVKKQWVAKYVFHGG